MMARRGVFDGNNLTTDSPLISDLKPACPLAFPGQGHGQEGTGKSKNC